MAAVNDAQEPQRPLLHVVKGDPTDEELAALVAVVSALGAAQVADERMPRSEWSSPPPQGAGPARPLLALRAPSPAEAPQPAEVVLRPGAKKRGDDRDQHAAAPTSRAGPIAPV